MVYVSGRPQRIAGEQFKPGDVVPVATVNRMKPNVIRSMLNLGRLRYDPDKGVPQSPKPVYRGSGWWEFPNGIKLRGPANRPPKLVED